MVISMDRWKGKIAVVTGASAGIGAAIVENLVKEGLIVVGLARRKELIEEIAKKLSKSPGKLYAIKADISKEDDILAAFKWIKANLGDIHIFINNAAVMRMLPLLKLTTQDYQKILDTNLLGLCLATKEAINGMIKNKIDGHVIQMNSILGHGVPSTPGFHVKNLYCATKHAITALTETMRQELNEIGSKIKISSVSPGFVDTDILKVGGGTNAKALKMAVLESEDIADAVAYVLGTPPHVQVHELIVKPIGETV